MHAGIKYANCTLVTYGKYLNSNGWTDYWDQLLLTIQISELMEITWIYKDSHTYHLLGKICTQYNSYCYLMTTKIIYYAHFLTIRVAYSILYIIKILQTIVVAVTNTLYNMWSVISWIQDLYALVLRIACIHKFILFQTVNLICTMIC